MNNDDNNRLKLPVILTMQDERTLEVDLIVNLGGAIDRTMNNDARFILVGDADGGERMIAKDAITEVIDAKKMAHRAQQAAGEAARPTVAAPGMAPEFTDPYQILGLTHGAGAEEVRNAFVQLAQEYNPDRFAHMGLPADVNDFCTNRYRQISEAYAQLTDGQTPAIADQTAIAV